MPKKPDAIRLGHMLEVARRAVRHAQSRSRKELETDELFLHGIVHMLLVLGEAAARVSDDLRERLPSIPWREVIGMRNHLIHGYDDVEHETVWRVLTEDLPPLITELERVLADLE